MQVAVAADIVVTDATSRYPPTTGCTSPRSWPASSATAATSAASSAMTSCSITRTIPACPRCASEWRSPVGARVRRCAPKRADPIFAPCSTPRSGSCRRRSVAATTAVGCTTAATNPSRSPPPPRASRQHPSRLRSPRIRTLAPLPRRSHWQRCCGSDPRRGRLFGRQFRRDDEVREGALHRLSEEKSCRMCGRLSCAHSSGAATWRAEKSAGGAVTCRRSE
jgi:hypothetical protein